MSNSYPCLFFLLERVIEKCIKRHKGGELQNSNSTTHSWECLNFRPAKLLAIACHIK